MPSGLQVLFTGVLPLLATPGEEDGRDAILRAVRSELLRGGASHLQGAGALLLDSLPQLRTGRRQDGTHLQGVRRDLPLVSVAFQVGGVSDHLLLSSLS